MDNHRASRKDFYFLSLAGNDKKFCVCPESNRVPCPCEGHVITEYTTDAAYTGVQHKYKIIFVATRALMASSVTSLSPSDTLLRLLSTQIGRDKIYRTTQYSARFIVALLLRFGSFNAKHDLIAKLVRLAGSIGQSRKCNFPY